MKDVPFILASSSPRRKELLEKMGILFTIVSPDVDENVSLSPKETVETLCRRKALAVADANPDTVVLAADTIVVKDGMVIGKPKSNQDAFRMISLLQGAEHQVLTGVCIVSPGQTLQVATEITTVKFANMTSNTIQQYIQTGEPFGKAGGYEIQGICGMFIEWIKGSYTNVVGLPTALVRSMLEKAGYFIN
jgi:septum formation protein